MKKLRKEVKRISGQIHVRKSFFVKSQQINVELEEYSFIKNKKWLNVFDLMELVSRLSYLEPNELGRNLSIADLVEVMIESKEKHYFSSSFRMIIMKNFMDSRPNEFDIHRKFEEEYESVMGSGYKLVRIKNDPKHMPDFWLKRDDSLLPVEIKLHGFKGAHLKQLQRYMDFYKCEHGIAVARNLECPLPSNIKFVSYENLRGINI